MGMREDDDDATVAPMTAASLAFERDFGPVLALSENPARPAHRRGQHKE